MFAYTIRRVISGLLLMVVMSMVTFILFYASSDHPERYACGPKCTTEQLKTTSESLGFDQPLAVQWAKFAKGFVVGRDFPDNAELRAAHPEQIVHCAPGCLGLSYTYGETVNTLLKDKLPVSISIAIAAYVIWIIGGVRVRRHRRALQGQARRQVDRRPVPARLRLPDVLHRPAAAEVRRDPVADREAARLHADHREPLAVGRAG